ncbi:cytochrome d ubiquinol oxidase subunit II [Microbacterium sp. EYE_5]|uniref:cytochrome d ubiquinol oxidase subunit II n=1 Tax=unclassified Microbacterium TaxID=2609290 RepID=UPI0020069841|nr:MULTISPECIES: cytochrome d ubiquinol oxidase subunit II [unclassified Microbacterium]MCK6080295.1 cytochrome d ubiquinol oxidase subunit II [Microbacterium sp. EYE_382]MCK6085566.1 cytochrome d ubiquinol oxidase subunit II [Microbacterium sp. EYE_384]MCK6122209.1 cytochrome d ubiquinol oxidase subunit II [Microbacterium sp. EYE_80]MCK6126329.1 cytochrome d ubiquinol oxidase subunit II [Microbacterium sp. EYE_79]MCK6141250.1 cytochrome d ubiquinol oxidase subunit II [Microbacterium sp. EYE_3
MDLATLWFFIVGAFFVGYFVLDGFDFGVGMSLPLLGRSEVARRQVINTIGPVWDLNETWVIVAGAALFAAFPEWYATLFSGFYLPLLLILLALILRGVSFEYRHQREGLPWKRRFDRMIVIGSVVPALLWGVAFGNIVQGVPIDADKEFTGTLLTLLNPYGLWIGVTTLLLFFLHGVYFVGLKTDGQVQEDAHRLARRAALPTIVFAAGAVVWTVVIAMERDAPLLWAVIGCGAVAAVALLASAIANARRRDGWAFALGAVTIVGAVLTLWTALFPFVMPSTTDPAFSLTITNASSSDYTLGVMTWAAVIFLPGILAYQAWTYWVFRKRVSRAHIEKADAAAAH